MSLIETEAQLEERLSAPSEADIAAMRRLTGDTVVLGAGGKMGVSLARLAKRASDAAGVARRVIAISRFSDATLCTELEQAGVETIACDLLNRAAVERLPQCENVLFLAGRKFGSTERRDLTWAHNVVVPLHVVEHYRQSRIVAFSTGNVYPFVKAESGGSVEADEPEPRGEYAQSCLGRERIFEFSAREHGTRVLIFRLNYAVDLRYGVLVDLARRVYTGQVIDVTVAHCNAIWQGDANSYALRALELCESPARVLNVTGPEVISVRASTEFFARRFNREVVLQGAEGERALLSNAAACFKRLGRPQIDLEELQEMVARWIECGGRSLGKPTKFEVMDGRF